MAPLVVIAFGFLLIIFNLLSHLGQWITAIFLPVTHPLSYSFDSYNELLKSTVKGDRVDYQALKRSTLLNDAVANLSKTSPDHLATPEEQLCFWINAYNLLVLKAVADLYPIQSIHQKLVPTTFSATKFLIGGTLYSLQDIYQLKLLPRLKSYPQAFFLVCGGTLGHPPLLNHAITPKNLHEDAESAAQKFVSNPQNVRLLSGSRSYDLSPLLKWNEGLFDKFGGPHEFVNGFLSGEALEQASNIMVTRTFARNFNWWLNDTATVNPKQ